jgi:hypothetical protein
MFLDGPAAARSDVEAEEILYCYQIGSVLPFVETVVPGTGLVGGRDPCWSESFCIPESVQHHLRTDREILISYRT